MNLHLNSPSVIPLIETQLNSFHDSVLQKFALLWNAVCEDYDTITMPNQLDIECRFAPVAWRIDSGISVCAVECKFIDAADLTLDFQGFEDCDWAIVGLELTQSHLETLDPRGSARMQFSAEVFTSYDDSGHWTTRRAIQFRFREALFTSAPLSDSAAE